MVVVTLHLSFVISMRFFFNMFALTFVEPQQSTSHPLNVIITNKLEQTELLSLQTSWNFVFEMHEKKRPL